MPNPGGINYEIRPTPSMGLGMFARRDIKRGELILAERPLLVVSSIPTFSQFLQPNISDRDAFLQPCFDWLTPDNYRALANSHTQDGSGPLHGVLRTNGSRLPYGEVEAHKCTAVYKEISRINHMCGGSLTQFPCILLLTYEAAVDRMHLISLRFRLSPANCEPCSTSRQTMKYLLRTVPYLNRSQNAKPFSFTAASSAPVLLALFPRSTIYTRTLVSMSCISQSPSMNGFKPAHYRKTTSNLH
jgi:hypothetical protein